MDEWDGLIEGIGKSLRGRPSREVSVAGFRPLEAEDLAIGSQVRRETTLPTSTPPELLKLRTRHHLIAQLLAIGMKPRDISLKTGYSISRISILQLDPAFKELLTNYSAENENLAVDVKERLRHLSMDSVDVIQHRLDDDPEQFTNKELMDLAEMTLDRTGHGKTATVQHSFGVEPEVAELFRQNRARPLVANLLEGELIDNGQGTARPEWAKISAESAREAAGDSISGAEGFVEQLDLFTSVPATAEDGDQAAGRVEEGGVSGEEAGVGAEGEVYSDAKGGAELSKEVYADAGKGVVVKFERNPGRSVYPA